MMSSDIQDGGQPLIWELLYQYIWVKKMVSDYDWNLLHKITYVTVDVAAKDKDVEKTETVDQSREDEKNESPKAVDSVSEQLEKLNVAAESEATKTQSAGDTAVTSSPPSSSS